MNYQINEYGQVIFVRWKNDFMYWTVDNKPLLYISKKITYKNGTMGKY